MPLYRFYILVIGLSPFILWALIVSDPLNFLKKILKFKRWYRDQFERYHGTRSTNQVIKKFKQEAFKNAYSTEVINDVIDKHKDQLVKINGKRIADRLYGRYERHPLEDY